MCLRMLLASRVGMQYLFFLIILDVAEGGKGLVASEDIKIGDVVLEIPEELVICDKIFGNDMV